MEAMEEEFREDCPVLKNQHTDNSNCGSNADNTKIDVVHKNMEEVKEDSIQTELYMKRWLVLFVYCQIALSNEAMWITFSSISSITIKYYNTNFYTINWLAMTFMLSGTVFAVPASYLLSKWGLRVCIIIAASLDAAGACLRYAGVGRDGFYLVALGQCLAAIAFAIVMQLPPKLAAVWFGEHERATATSIGVLMNMFGIAIGFLLSTNLVHDNTDMDKVRQGMDNLLSSQAWFCVACVVATYIIVDEKPKLPPSRSQAMRDNLSDKKSSFMESLRTLFNNRNFNITAQAYAINFALIEALPSLLNPTVASKYKSVSGFWVGMLGFTAVSIGCVCMFLVGLVIDTFQNYKQVAVTLFLLATLATSSLTIVLLCSQSFVLLFVVYCLLSAIAYPYTSSGLEQIAEIIYPIEEDISASVALVISNFYGFLCMNFLGLLINKGHVLMAYIIITLLYFLGLLLSLLAEVTMRRTLADKMPGD